MGAVTETGELYSAPVAFIYIFNLIIGVGALTMPKAFAAAGWIVSTIVICILAFMSFVTSTFMVEAMAAANAVLRIKEKNWGAINGEKSTTTSQDEEIFRENEPLINFTRVGQKPNLYDITTRVEMGQMARMFYGKSNMQDSTGSHPAAPSNATNHSQWKNVSSDSSEDHCWGNISKENVYRIYLLMFTVTLGPFAFFNVQKTKYLQMLTTVMRWLAFSMVIVLAVLRIFNGKGNKHVSAANFSGVPNLFGVCIYAFMCQHSLPSFITPMRDKSRVTCIFSLDFGIILLFYAVMSFSGMFAFNDLNDLYTLNFQNYTPFIHYFLALFPVFTLSTNFPIISITLRDNLKNLFYREGRQYSWTVDRLIFPIVTIIPPIGIAFATQNLEMLVGITGSYAGAGVQYVIPTTLVYCARKEIRSLITTYNNKHRSIFRQRSWLFFVLVWTVICVCFVSANHIITKK
ncbi:transmembrane protein 104 [Exaiptasia diaphana]|uniref:Amino acid transporter transmembrane domain-containing protein n=1 Tax=Exaiptasia diaphana TaxID=2652724 RepID=A0A913X5T2_EXADI|nr:transmembrane protein 104 [Exaiptasia diaphana]